MGLCIQCIIILLYITCLICLLSIHSAVVIRARKSNRVASYRIFSMALAIFLSAVILETANTSINWNRFIVSLYAVGALGSALAFFWLAMTAYLNPVKVRYKHLFMALPAVAACTIIILDPVIDIYNTDIGLAALKTGRLLWTMSIIAGVYAVIGLVMLLISLQKQHQDKKKLAVIYLAVFVLPVTAAVVYIVNPDLMPFDPIPLASAAGSLFLALAAIRYQFLDIMPMARRDIMDEMESLLAIARFDGMIIDCNDAFSRICDMDRRDIIGKNINELIVPVMDRENQLSNMAAYNTLLDANNIIIKELELSTVKGRGYFEVMAKPVYSRKNKLLGRFFRISELSHERQLRQLIADQNKQLAAANYSLSKRTRIAADLKRMTVRNQLARELHDQLGHTIIMTLSSVDRIDKIEEERERWEELERLMKKVTEQLQRSLPEKNRADNNSLAGKIYGISSILNEIKQESEHAGIVLNFDIQGETTVIPTDHYHDLQQILRETVTNAIKHGEAKQVDCFLMITDSQYDLIIADNGHAGEDYEKGFGLKNMEKRVEELKGTIKFQNESSGFAVFIKIPLR